MGDKHENRTFSGLLTAFTLLDFTSNGEELMLVSLYSPLLFGDDDNIFFYVLFKCFNERLIRFRFLKIRSRLKNNSHVGLINRFRQIWH